MGEAEHSLCSSSSITTHAEMYSTVTKPAMDLLSFIPPQPDKSLSLTFSSSSSSSSLKHFPPPFFYFSFFPKNDLVSQGTLTSLRFFYRSTFKKVKAKKKKKKLLYFPFFFFFFISLFVFLLSVLLGFSHAPSRSGFLLWGCAGDDDVWYQKCIFLFYFFKN